MTTPTRCCTGRSTQPGMTGTHVRHVATALACLAMLAAAPAALANSVRQIVVVNGTTALDQTKTSAGSISVAQSFTVNDFNATVAGRAFSGGTVGALASTSGTVNAKSQVTAKSSGSYQLAQPAGAAIAGGKVVLQALLSGEITGTATMDLTVDVDLYAMSGITRGSASRALADQPGREEVEFGVEVALPAAVDPREQIEIDPALTLNAIATLAGGGTLKTSTADALDSGKIVGFRVFNAAGAQVTGFTLTGGGKSIPEIAPPPVGKALAVEYFNAEFAHYFITTNADEIAKLDAGVIKGWQRTGQSFNVFASPGAGLVAVCRFFSASFAPKSSHFYAPRGLGCEAVLANPAWTFEGDVFYTALPAANGTCPAGNIPVYRLYNNGQGGAPNHRFTTSESIQLDMIRDGYVAEGTGTGVGMCSPQ